MLLCQLRGIAYRKYIFLFSENKPLSGSPSRINVIVGDAIWHPTAVSPDAHTHTPVTHTSVTRTHTCYTHTLSEPGTPSV